MKKKKKMTVRQPGALRNRILKIACGVLILTGIILFFAGGMNDNVAVIIVGIALFPAAGIVITPLVVKEARNDNKSWKSKFNEQRNMLYKAGLLETVSDMTPYQNKLIWGVRRLALRNLLFLVLVLGVTLVGSFLGIKERIFDNEFLSFILLVGVVTFGIPISAYNIACSAYRIRTVKRCEYNAYHTVVKGANGMHMWIMDDKERVIKFDYCKRLGIRAKNIHDTELILVFVPDEVYLLPNIEEQPKKGDYHGK